MKRIIATVLVLSTLAFLQACKEEKHHESSGVFSVTKPWHQDVEINMEYVAQIKAIQHIEVRAIEKGYLENIFVDEGQSIKKGDKMFQIMPNLMQAEYDKAKAEFEVTRIEYTNTQKLYQQKVVSKNELALKKANLDRKQAVLNLAKTRLEFTTISAPFDGIMDRFHVRLGSLVEEGELLTALSDISSLWVYFNVSERTYLNYKQANQNNSQAGEVKLRMANGAMFEQVGKIDTIEADFDNETGNIAFRATFPNPTGLLRHGETGNVILTENVKNALVVPQKAVFDVLDKHFVFTVDNSGKIVQKEVFIANEVPHLFLIKDGIGEQDTVLIEGLGKVTAGAAVKTKFQEVAEVKKSFELEAH